MQKGNCNCIDFQNANWEPDTGRNTIHPQNVGEIDVGGKKDKAYSFFVSVFMLICLVVGSNYSINPIIIYSGCAVVHGPLFCQFKRKREDKLWLKDNIFRNLDLFLIV